MNKREAGMNESGGIQTKSLSKIKEKWEVEKTTSQ